MASRRYTFPRSHRLRGRDVFKKLYDQGMKEVRGPLVAFALRNDLPHPRLGISVPKRIGHAPKRNRIRRMIRESFRLLQHDAPFGYDLLIIARSHDPQMLADYQRLLSGLIVRLIRKLQDS
jgi:ribonuclease P protein component